MPKKIAKYILGLIFFVGLLLVDQSCKTPIGFTKISNISELTEIEKSPLGLSANCKKSAAYVPTMKHLSHTPEKVIRINFHFMNNTAQTVNYDEATTKRYARDLLVYCHKSLDLNTKSNIPLGNDYPVIPSRYRYELTSSEGYEKEAGIYMHNDDDLYYFLFKGKDRNLGSRKMYDKYAIGQDSILNIFLTPHFPDSVASPTYGFGGAKGVALGTHVKISGMHKDKFDPWSNRGNLNHEIGHIFSLGHAWRRDGCDDTPEHDNKCFAPDGTECDSLTSNNMMDYNTFQAAITPCQLGRVHQKMTMKSSRVKKFIRRDWCTFDASKTLTIRDSVSWTGEKDLSGNIIIEPSGFLEILCRVSLPPGGKIMVKPGGTLLLNNAWLHNDCDKTWDGIFIETTKNQTGKVLYIGNPEIENTIEPFSLDQSKETLEKNKQK